MSYQFMIFCLLNNLQLQVYDLRATVHFKIENKEVLISEQIAHNFTSVASRLIVKTVGY